MTLVTLIKRDRSASLINSGDLRRVAMTSRRTVPRESRTPRPFADWLDAMTTTPDATRQAFCRAVVEGALAADLWYRLDGLYLLAAADSQAAGLNLVAPSGTAITAVNSPTFTTDRGYAGDGSTSYLDTGLTLTSAAHYALNSACMFVWSLTDSDVSGAIDLGTASGSNALIETSSASGNLVTSANDSTLATVSVTNSQGLLGWSRGSSASYDRYQNMTALGAVSDVSSAVGAGNVLVDHYSARQVAACGWGGYLDTDKWGALYGILYAYLHAVGAV